MICVRGQCAESNRGRQLEQLLLDLIERHGLADPDHPQYVSCTVTNCLGVCADGPVMIIHPEAVKYHHVTPAALERIFQQHLLGNRPVEELIVREAPVKSILKNIQRKDWP
ncbi:MAG: hypothetical protein DPW09_27515 [Anaerolineae bacterium]|nr:hypothetical protein [Anaerolineae bacterium]